MFSFSEDHHVNELHKAIYLGNRDRFMEIIGDIRQPALLSSQHVQKLFLLALNCGRLEIAKFLIEKEIESLNEAKKDICRSTQILTEILKNNDIELVDMWSDTNQEPISRSCRGDTVLHLAVSNSSERIIRHLLLHRGADVNSVDSKGMYPLHTAAKRGNVELIKLILDAGACVSSKSIGHVPKTALIFAIENNDVNTVKLLLKHGAHCDDKSIEEGLSALLVAMRTPNIDIDIVKQLVGAGADLDHRNVRGQTPLHLACIQNNCSVVNILLIAGADINILDNEGLLPFDALIRHDSVVGGLRIGVFSQARLTTLLIKEVIKLTEANLYVHNKNKAKSEKCMALYGVGGPTFETYNTNKLSCQKEIGLMKCFKNETGKTVFDILQKVSHPLGTATQTDINTFTTITEEDTYPMYTGILKNRLRRAHLRKTLLTQAMIVFDSFINGNVNWRPNIPKEMSMNILLYLTDSELSLFLSKTAE